MRRLGKHPADALDTGGTSVQAHVERVLDDAMYTIQGEGWFWNTKDNVSLGLNSSSQAEISNLEIKDTLTITNTSSANPCVVTTSAAHGLVTGTRVRLSGITPTTHELNDRYFYITIVDTTNFSLDDENGSLHKAYASGGICETLYEIFHADTYGDSKDTNVVRNGDYFYDLTENTDALDGTIKISYSFEKDFSSIPDSFQQWIIAQAAFSFNRFYVGNQSRDGALQVEIQNTRRMATREEIRTSDTNVLDTAEMRQIRGRPRMPDRSIY